MSGVLSVASFCGLIARSYSFERNVFIFAQAVHTRATHGCLLYVYQFIYQVDSLRTRQCVLRCTVPSPIDRTRLR